MSTQSQILLQPRPYASSPGRLLLLPLLPHRKPLKPLPSEIWSHIFNLAVLSEGGTSMAGSASALLTVCKGFSEAILPLVYANVCIPKTSTLESFCSRLHAADQKWDSIRRIPYSAPGRWVQVLDISSITFTSRLQALQMDSLLTSLFPLVPFLAHFSLNPSFLLSKRAVKSLACREGTSHIRSLRGIGYVPSISATAGIEGDPLVELLRRCINLEELEVIDQGPDPSESEFLSDLPTAELPEPFIPLSLDHLHTLTLLSMHSSPLMLAMLESPLPILRKLTITPYDDIPYPTSLVNQFLATHGVDLRSLSLFTPKSWPSRLHPSPPDVLLSSPSLRHLSLEFPLPELLHPQRESLSDPHPLQILSIPRPTPDFWLILQRLLPHLPSLLVVRSRDVRWLRKGMTSRAQEAGIQGELREWQRRLNRRGIRVLDADWQENN